MQQVDYKRAYEREKQARRLAEVELEKRARELYDANLELKETNTLLEQGQEHLIRNERMYAAGQMYAAVAHEINNPLSYLLSNLGQLEDYHRELKPLLELACRLPASRAGSKLPEAALRKLKSYGVGDDLDHVIADIDTIHESLRTGLTRVREIVDNLRSFTNTNRDAWEHADLHKLIERTLTLMRQSMSKRADLERRFGQLPRIHCNPNELVQVFVNVLKNSLQAFGDKRGTIRITTRAKDSFCRVSVQDSGAGMTQDQIQHAFEPFFTTKSARDGTGLGLYVVKGIVERHAGLIKIASGPGRGTRVDITLPVAEIYEDAEMDATGSFFKIDD